jgi:translation elongation factor EF-G
MLMFTKFGPLYRVCVVVEKVWYHEVDSSRPAFRHAGRIAGRKIVEAIGDGTDDSPVDVVPG